MTSKEALKQLEKEIIIYDDEEHKSHYGILGKRRKNLIEIIEKDLEDYEELKKIMGTPIQEIMRKLKEFETVKEFVINQTAFYDTGCCLDEYIYYDTEIGNIFKNWNEE